MSVDLRARLAKSEPFYFSWMTLPGAIVAGQVARLPYEGVCIDMQHGLAGFTDVASMSPAITQTGKPLILRILWNDPGLVGQALDAGASVVIAPMVNTANQAQALVKAAKYAPQGMRSWGGYAAVQAAGVVPADYLKEANRRTMVFAMIETEEALGNLDAIAATPGLDGLFVGPNDLSISLGFGLGKDLKIPKLEAAIKSIAAAAKKNGLVPGAFGGSPQACAVFAGHGFRFIAAATDVGLMAAGAKALQDQMAEI
ncbi:HpcH/HpaI aldolase family protein [Taklimakanibacter lacteus]|uniref:HpcH/HpaI aldolase family protein n=1 Tax=Taklimakanibacter lacteus TaxID=2268456 RepID=UPI000E66DA60